MHGGSIDVISQVDEGTKFTFSLPIMDFRSRTPNIKNLHRIKVIP